MYRFKRTNGTEARIYFSHKGGKKGKFLPGGQSGTPGKSPRRTECSIVSDDNNVLLGKGQAAPLATIYEELPPGCTEAIAQKIYGNRLKRITVKNDGKLYAVLKGDIFCRAEGRKKSLRKALASLPKEDRLNAWIAVGEIIVVVEEEDEIIDLINEVK
jgi:hypothetical protein